LAFPPEADEPMVQATIFILFWLKPNMFCNLDIPDINVGATLNIICVISINNKKYFIQTTHEKKFN